MINLRESRIPPHKPALIAATTLIALGVTLTTQHWSTIDPALLGMCVTVIGIFSAIGALLWGVFKRGFGPHAALFDEGFDVGYGQGWHDGHRVAKPVVVRARCPHCDGPLNAPEQDTRLGKREPKRRWA